jgi:hypothetical protein
MLFDRRILDGVDADVVVAVPGDSFHVTTLPNRTGPHAAAGAGVA